MMAKRKRASTSERPGGSRKRPCSPNTTPLVREQKLVFNSWMVQGTNNFVHEGYNRYVPFCDKPSAGTATEQAAAKVQERLFTLQEILDDATERYQEQLESLEHEVEHFVQVSHERDLWWMSANILVLPMEEVEAALETHPPRDAAALSKYFGSLLPSELIALRASTTKVDQQQLIEKALRLIATFFALPGGRPYAVHAYAEYVDTVLSAGEAHHTIYNHMLEALFRGLWGHEPHVVNESERLRTIVWLSGECPSYREGIPPLRPFMDLPLVVRKLEHAYQTVDRQCSTIDQDLSCPHTALADSLEDVQREAYGEVRGKAMLTIGSMLPAELVEEVLNWALVAEELSVETESYYRSSGLEGIDEKDHCPVVAQMKEYEEEYDEMNDFLGIPTRGVRMLRSKR